MTGKKALKPSAKASTAKKSAAKKSATRVKVKAPSTVWTTVKKYEDI